MKKNERAIVVVLIIGFLSLFSGIGIWFLLLAKQSKGSSESFLSTEISKQIAASGVDLAKVRLMEDATKNFSTFLYGPYRDGTVDKADWAYPKEEFIDRNLNGKYDRGEKLCSPDYDQNGSYTPSVPLEKSLLVSYHKVTLPLKEGNILRQVGVSGKIPAESDFYKYYSLKILDSHSQIWINGPVELDSNGNPLLTAYGGHILSSNAINMLNTLGDVVILSNGMSINENFPFYKLGERIALMMSRTKGGEFFAEVQLTSNTYGSVRLSWEEYEALKDFISVEGKKFKLLDPRYLSDVECEPDTPIPDVKQTIRLTYKKCEYIDTKNTPNLVVREPHGEFADFPIQIIESTTTTQGGGGDVGGGYRGGGDVGGGYRGGGDVGGGDVGGGDVRGGDVGGGDVGGGDVRGGDVGGGDVGGGNGGGGNGGGGNEGCGDAGCSGGGHNGGPGLPDILPLPTASTYFESCSDCECSDPSSCYIDSNGVCHGNCAPAGFEGPTRLVKVVSLYRVCPSLYPQGQQQLRRVSDHLNTSYGKSVSSEPDPKKSSPKGKIGITYQERVPINLNTAPREVLIALFKGIRATYIDYQKSSTLSGVKQLTNEITMTQAARVADYIIAYRKKQPFRSYRDIEAFFSGDQDKILAACGRTNLADCYDLKCSTDYGTTNFDWKLSFLDNKQKEAILANILPQSRISKFNPDITLGRNIHSVDKSDLVDWTTEATFTSYGYFEVEGLGSIAKVREKELENVLVARSKLVTIYRLWDTLHLQSQKDFEESSEQVVQDKKVIIATSPKKDNTVTFPENVANSSISADWDGYISVKPEQLPIRDISKLTFQSDLYSGLDAQKTNTKFAGTIYDGRSIIDPGADGSGICPSNIAECTKEWTNLVQSSLFPDGVWLNEFKRYPYNYNPQVNNEYGTNQPSLYSSYPISLDTYLRYPSKFNFSPDSKAEEGFMEMWVKPSWSDTEQEVLGSDYLEEDTRTFFSMGGGVERGILQIEEPSCNSNAECEIFTRSECPGAKLECRNNKCECPEQICRKKDCSGLNCPPDSIEVECNGVCKCVKDPPPPIEVGCYKDKNCNSVNCEWNKECIYVDGEGQAQKCRCVFNCDNCDCKDLRCKDICKDKCSSGGSCPTDANALVNLFNNFSQIMEATCTNCMSTNSCSTPNPYIPQFDCQCLCKGFEQKAESTRCKEASGGCFGGDGPTGRWCKICGKCTVDTCQAPQDCKICRTFRRVGGGGRRGGGGCTGYGGGPGLPDIIAAVVKMSSTMSNGMDYNGDGICDAPPGDPNMSLGEGSGGIDAGGEWSETDVSCTSCNFDCANGKCECTAMNLPENYLTCSADSSCPLCNVGYSRVKCSDNKCYCIK